MGQLIEFNHLFFYQNYYIYNDLICEADPISDLN